MRTALLAATAIAGLTVAASPASATLQIAALINGTTFFCADQTACDTNATIGTLTIANQTIAGVEINGSSQVQQIGPTNSLNTSSLQITNHNAVGVSIQVAVGGTDFLGPTATYTASGSGTFQSAVGSNVTLTFFGDPSNTQGADTSTDLPGTLLATITKSATLATDAFADNAAGAFVAGDPFGMSLGTVGFLTAGGSLVSRGQAILVEQAVPEPATLGILGLGLLGLVGVRKRHT